MRTIVCFALLLACREQHTEPPTGEPVKPPRSSAWLTPEAGVRVAPPNTHAQRLFADGVPTETLALSIGLETAGGASTVLIPRGATLPVSKTEVFSTAEDDQSSIEVHLLQGENAMALDNRSLGKYHLVEIPPGPRGVVQIEMTFHVDQAGMLVVSAHERKTRFPQPIVLRGAPAGPIDQPTVDKFADAARGARLARRRAMREAMHSLKNWSLAAETTLESRDKLSAKTVKRLDAELEAARQMLANVDKLEPQVVEAAADMLGKTVQAAARERDAKP